MKRALIFISVILWSIPVSAGWQEGMWIGVPDMAPKQVRPIGVWCYPSTGCVDQNNQPSPFGAWNVWHTVNISADVPASTIGVFLNGMLLITNPNLGTICDVEVWFRAPGVTLPTCTQSGGAEPCLKLNWQTVDQHNGGQRTNAAAVVPVIGGKFEFMWTVIGWGTGCSLGMNVGVDGYVRQ